ncbi:MAG: DUF2079 domain-containing protein [Flavobacteriales bacterium]|nr:DUF2079 domain-containing protein [Flavobacteriales bacterium]
MHKDGRIGITIAPIRRVPLMVLVLFAIVYALIFVPNQLFFRTYALDLGLYTHAAFAYAHGGMADCMLFLGTSQPLLADHFDLHLMLWSPLTWLFGQWSLLIVQWIAVLVGGWGIWRWLRELGATPVIANLGLIHFLAFFGIYGAFTFDFHSNVVAAMAIPWYGLALHKRRSTEAWLLLLFMLSAKENMGIWLCFVVLGFLLHERKNPALRKLLAWQAVIALMWSAVVIGVVMPALSDGAHYAGWKYPALGDGPIDALGYMAIHPIQVFQALLDGGSVPGGRAIKIEMLVLLFLAGGWAMLMRPWILLMAVPLLLQKLLHAGPAQWGVLGHYSVEFAPLCTLAVFSWALSLRNSRRGKVIAVIATVLSLGVTVRILDASVYKENRAKQRIYHAEHYVRGYDAAAVRQLLQRIPANASVSASAAFVPHLVVHRNLYQFPILGDADVIALATKEEPYPLSVDEFTVALDTLRRSRFWTEMDRCDGAVVFTRSQR